MTAVTDHLKPAKFKYCLMVRPTFLNDMCGILFCFCSHRYRFATDLLHLTLNEADCDYTWLPWLSDPTDPESDLTVYRFRAVLFGSVSSPFMLNATLHYHLRKFSTPIAADIEINLYVDNVIISGCDSEIDAVDYYNTPRSIMVMLSSTYIRSRASNTAEV